MPEFQEYPTRVTIDGSEVFVILHGGSTKTIAMDVIADAIGAVTGPPGPTGAPGGGWFGRYTFKTATADADPGAGNMRLNNATQNAATVLRIDTLGNDLIDNTNILALLDDSTSAVKGLLRMYHEDDASKFIIFAVQSLATPTGYYNVTVTPLVSSTANPFVADDNVLLTFTATGDKGQTGDQGDEGPQGQTGYPYIFDNPTSDADPGAGRLRLNHATLSSATFLYIDDVTNGGVDISAWLLTLADSTSPIKGFLHLNNVGQTKSRIYKVEAAITDAAGYVKIPIVHVGGAGTFTDEEPVYFSFDRTGDKGEDPIALTSAEYEALDPPDPDAYYYITDLPS